MHPRDPRPKAPEASEPREGSLSQRLREMAGSADAERVSIADLLLALQDRALAALLLLFALPNVLPTLPGASALLGAPLLFLAAQLCLGRPAWLPGFIGRRSISRAQFEALLARATPWLDRAEQLLRPRLSVLASAPAQNAIGAVCLLLSLIIFLPIPLGNMLPALAICLMALGLLGRDGWCVLAGLFTAVTALGLVWGVVYALIEAIVFVLARGLSA